MKRFLYEWLLRLHPADFRDRFADEMMLNFEEAEQSKMAVGLFGDCVVSLLRQWLLHWGWWKLVPAIFCAFLQVMALSLHVRLRPHPVTANAPVPVSLGHLVISVAALTVLVTVMTAICVGNFMARRLDNRPRPKRSVA